ncbi:MAG: hypothetical protein M3Z54_07015, partial [Gemmatimonadota bacterium]|nr:hypothetical protein [Gemmatimonadota bacterium]
RTWPCADTQTIPTNTLNGNVNVTVPAGDYTSFSVHVTAVPSASTSPLPAVVGDGIASVQYKVQPTGPGLNGTWTVNPAAGSHGPTQVWIQYTVSFPPPNTTFRFRITCGPGCQPGETPSPLPLGANNSYTLSTMVSVGQPQLYAYIDEVQTCNWVASWSAYKFDYYLAP